MTTTNPPVDESRARRLYPDAIPSYRLEGDETVSVYNYNPIVESFGEVLVRVDDTDYQGDSRLLYRKDGRYGFLGFGWGSCSGCDALQNCKTFADIEGLIQELERSIKWFDTLGEAKAYIADTAANEVRYHYHTEEWQAFVTQVQAYHGKPSNTDRDIAIWQYLEVPYWMSGPWGVGAAWSLMAEQKKVTYECVQKRGDTWYADLGVKYPDQPEVGLALVWDAQGQGPTREEAMLNALYGVVSHPETCTVPEKEEDPCH